MKNFVRTVFFWPYLVFIAILSALLFPLYAIAPLRVRLGPLWHLLRRAAGRASPFFLAGADIEALDTEE